MEIAHGILRAVRLAGGEKEVVFRYREERFGGGLAITLVCLALALALLAAGLLPRFLRSETVRAAGDAG